MSAKNTRSKKIQLSPSLNHRYVMNRTDQALAFKPGETDFNSWRRKLRRKVRGLVGMDRMPAEKCPLNVRKLWSRSHPLGTIEKISFTAEPRADVPAFVCTPKNAEPPYTWFICLQGHSTGMHNSIAVDRDDNSRGIEVAGDRDFALGCMSRGIAALCIEQRAFGERREQDQEHISSHGCHDAAMHALMLGRTLLGERVYDVDRAIDYLCTRDDVDRKRIGVMGNSGGGTVSLFSAALLDRISFCMPSCYFCTFRDSVMSIYHCADNYVPGLLEQAEMPDVMGLFAPKPVVAVAGREDDIFPVAAVRTAFRHLKKIYRAAGEALGVDGNRCHLVVGPEGHRFYADQAWPVMLKELRR